MTLPILTANLSDGEGNLDLPNGWGNLHPLLKADLIKDWMQLLNNEYIKARFGMRSSKEELTTEMFSMLKTEDTQIINEGTDSMKTQREQPAKLLRLTQVQELYPVSKTEIYRQMKKGTFPKAIKIGKSAIAWLQSDIEKHILELQKKSIANLNITPL